MPVQPTLPPGITRQFNAACIIRTAISLLLLLAFWGALAYTFWPEIATGLLRLAGTVRGIGAVEVESAYFQVRDRSSAGEEQVHRAIRRLEADYAAIHAFLDRRPDDRLPVLIVDGPGPAWTDGVRLNLFCHDGAIDLSIAPFFLVLLSEGELGLGDLSPFLEAGFAVYVAEEIDRAQDLIGQPADAWVVLFRQNGTLRSLPEAWETGLPGGEQDLPDFVRAALEGGSFVRWLAGAFGLDAVQQVRDGSRLEDVTGLSPADAERAWLASVTSRALSPLPCAQAVPEGSLLRGFCPQLEDDVSSPARP